ncbi:succinate dehydrogenase, cytochrome b556 subunit [Devosia psychrophila]|jgi:succinate dehydrogenase / fumarate reductase cytochrome b subunit|uniref:Succinate dehydrogenase cytochrome b556 subunit n=1 Tax=Devosia psychrophila TaxID=728005 RepID=A0A0F5PXP5_9HYPH|nr:succinate dehydrogenase, cytochrome b556 subunit [Devosia psychrophila]KKC33447.1 succinate dehydrogenase [Devosia psychrophila]SFB92159.1 succinate dehydrogenase subunit C [Devosia psychrophila]
MTVRSRPLSPHLQVYRWTITMTMSILHRATGIANYFGTVLLVAWLAAAAWGQQPLNLVNDIYGSWFGQLVLFGFTWSLIHHMLGGLRHFVWDFIIGMEAGQREMLAWANVIASVVLTLVVWTLFVWMA